MADVRSLTFVLTSNCNLRCEYCYALNKGNAALDWNTVENVLDRVVASTGRSLEVSFTGGEPLLAFATIRRAMEHTERAFPSARVGWRVLTNGLLLDGDMLAFLDQRDVSVHLSMDGVAAAQDVRGRGSFRRLDALLDRLPLEHPRLFQRHLTVAMTLCPAAVPFLADSVGYLLRKRVRSFSVAPAMAVTRWDARQIDELRSQFDRLTDDLMRHYERTLEMPFLLFQKTQPDPASDHRERVCDAGNGAGLVVDVDGEVYGCVLAAGSYRAAPPPSLQPALTALHAGPGTSADLSRRIEAMSWTVQTCNAFLGVERKYSSYGRCADCEFFHRCHVCPLACAPLAEWPDADRVPDFLCAFNQVALSCRDRFPCQPDVHALLRTSGGRTDAAARQ